MTGRRKEAFVKGLSAISARKSRKMTRAGGRICAIAPRLYNASGMPDLNQIINGDSIKVLNDGPEGWVDLCFADPPFNIGYLYHGYDDQRDDHEYLEFSEKWMKAVHRALKPNGSFYLAIGDDFAAELTYIAKRNVGFHLRNWIIWHYTFGQQPKSKFARSHTHILYFTKDKKEFTFNADAVRVASARQTTYKDSRANPKGKLPDDVWFLRPQDAAAHAYLEKGGTPIGCDRAEKMGYFDVVSDTWNVSRVCGTFKEREGWHGCQMPIGVLNRIIAASSNENDVVLDPFNGSGTTVVAAALLNRHYVGIDQSAEYVRYAQKRLEHALDSAAKDGKNGSATIVFDPKRASRVMTKTDALGRPRVARAARRGSRAAKSA
jgi:site-specific DNA-methyltransferase (adenine-specific)